MKGKSNNKIFFPNLIVLIVGLAVVLFSIYNIVNLGMMKSGSSSVLNTMENEYYVVGKDPTNYQKDVFKLLSEELEKTPRDDKKVADLVAQSFVIDFFNWSNKDAAYDVGGLQYMYDPTTFGKVANFEYYQKVDIFNSTYGKGNLPIVKDVVSKTEKVSDYKIEDTFYEAYKSVVTWKYEDSKKPDTKDFIDSCEIILVNVDGKLSIAEIKMIDEVKTNE